MKSTGGFWNYRIVFHRGKGRNPEHYLALHEAHYDGDQRDLPVAEAMPRFLSNEPTTLHAEDLDGMQWVMKKIEAALEKPILEWRDSKIVRHEPDAPDPLQVARRKKAAAP